MEAQNKNEKRKKMKERAIWLLLLLLLIGNIYHFTKPTRVVVNTPQLGTGEEVILQDKERPEKIKGKLGMAVPSSVNKENGQVVIYARNTGKVAVIVSAHLADKEVYRASRWLEPGERINYAIDIGNHKEVKTLVESLDGEKFFVVSKIN